MEQVNNNPNSQPQTSEPRSRWVTWLAYIAGALVVVYGLFVTGFALLSDYFIFPYPFIHSPPRTIRMDRHIHHLQMKRDPDVKIALKLYLHLNPGEKSPDIGLHKYMTHSTNPPVKPMETKKRRTVLFFHGNAEDLDMITPHLIMMWNWGFNVIAMDYQGYGQSDGHPSATNVCENAMEVLNYVEEMGLENIFLYGRSVGGAPAVYLAASQKPCIQGLILESAFASIMKTITTIPLIPQRWDKMPNYQYMRSVQCPVYIFHGGKDNIVPVRNAFLLYKNAVQSSHKVLKIIPLAHHNNMSGFIEMRKSLHDILDNDEPWEDPDQNM